MGLKHIATTVCIIGAGPAGATTSIFLSKKKIPHIIIDAAVFPRDKVCGDGIDLRSIRILNHIDATIFKTDITGNEDFKPSLGLRLIHPSGKNCDFAFKPNETKPHYYPYYVCKRMNFDNFLVSKIDTTYASFYQASKVVSIEKNEDDWKICAVNSEGNIEITCKLLVGADGDHSVVLRYLGERKINRQHYQSSVRQYWKNVTDLHPNNLLEFYFPPKYPLSYFWIFPLANGEANVGFIMASKYATDNNHNIRKLFTEIIATDPLLKHRFNNATPVSNIEGWGLPLASLNRKPYGDGWLLVGDAASLISPISGEGIGNSMLSGYIAAEFIEKAVASNCFTAQTFTNYNRELYKHFKQEISRFRFFENKHPYLRNWLINQLISNNFFVHKIFQKNMRKWLITAYEKRIDVVVD